MKKIKAKTNLIKGGIQYFTGKMTGNRMKKAKGIGHVLQGKIQERLP